MPVGRLHAGPPKGKRKEHVIDEASNGRDFVRCECGWEGKIGEFKPHRVEMGMRTR